MNKKSIKRILMISDNDITSTESLGVTKKLLGQYKAFGNLGYDTYHLCFKDRQGVLIHGDATTVLVKPQIKMYLTYIKLLKKADKICKENGIDMCYIRYPLADFAFMKMVKKLHKLCKVVIEIPTYPYDEQNKALTDVFSRYKSIADRHHRKKLKNLDIVFTTFNNKDSIFGVPCINISNGIDVASVKYIGDKLEYGNTINIFAVALIVREHGYDRLIEGLKNYYADKTADAPDVYFNIAGDGPEREPLTKMVKDYGLSGHVVFHGKKFGKELDDMFCQNNLALSCLGYHRAGLTVVSTLKAREYCARGIPFISSLPESALPVDLDFYALVESGENPVDIEEIIKYYKHIKAHPDIPEKMRKYAEENLTWEKQLKKVVL